MSKVQALNVLNVLSHDWTRLRMSKEAFLDLLREINTRKGSTYPRDMYEIEKEIDTNGRVDVFGGRSLGYSEWIRVRKLPNIHRKMAYEV